MTSRALTIAGSDVSGGAGLEADLKMFDEFGIFGTAVVTCIVTFDSEKDFEHDVEFLDTEVIIRQLESALSIHAFDVLKSGMVGSLDSALVLAEKLQRNRLPYVFDPVLVCKGSGTMVDLSEFFKEKLIPLSTVITPNVEEAAVLIGADDITTISEMIEAAQELHGLGADTVVIKGGARLAGEEAVDVVYDGRQVITLSAPKVTDSLVNGAGCSFASSIAAGLALGNPVLTAIANAKQKVAHGIARSVDNNTGVRSLFHPASRINPHPEVRITQSTRNS